MFLVKVIRRCLPRSCRKMILKVGTWLFVKLKNAAKVQRYATYRAKYHIPPSFRFNGEGILLYDNGESILGEGSYIGLFSWIQSKAREEVVIGRNVHISHFCKMYTGNLVPDQELINKDELQKRTGLIRIGDGCWVGTSVFIREGVTIGEDTVVGANSVVTHDLPPHCIAAGCPARVIRYKRNASAE